MAGNEIKKDFAWLKEHWNELTGGMECGYYWLSDADRPEICENGDVPEFPCKECQFVVESCWYKKGVKSVEIRFAGGRYIVSEVCWNGAEPQNTKEYYVAPQTSGKILFSEIIDEEDGSIKKIIFTGFGK